MLEVATSSRHAVSGLLLSGCCSLTQLAAHMWHSYTHLTGTHRFPQMTTQDFCLLDMIPLLRHPSAWALPANAHTTHTYLIWEKDIAPVAGTRHTGWSVALLQLPPQSLHSPYSPYPLAAGFGTHTPSVPDCTQKTSTHSRNWQWEPTCSTGQGVHTSCLALLAGTNKSSFSLV